MLTSIDGQKYLMGDKLRPAVYASSPDGFGTGKETAARKVFQWNSPTRLQTCISIPETFLLQKLYQANKNVD